MTAPLVEEIHSIEALGGILLDIDQKFQHADFTDTFNQFIPQIEQEERAAFAGEKTPGGEEWQPLAPFTNKKKGHARRLYESGALMAAMIDHAMPHHIGEITDRWMTYGTDLEYAGFHQDGTDRIPQREFAGLSEETVDRLAGRVADDLVEKLKYTVRG